MDTGGAGSVRDWLADQLLRQIDVRPSRESSVININYAASNPHAPPRSSLTRSQMRTSRRASS